jgi:peptidase M16 domain protein
MQDRKIKDGISLHSLQTNKFKTFTLSFYIHRPLKEEEVTLNALLPFIMKRGSVLYPNLAAISKKLEELYGGFFDCGIRKKGEDQVICFNFEFVSPKYVKNDPQYLNEVYRFVFDIVLNPLIYDGGFKEEYVIREKENLKDHIEGLINDKKEYASLRCLSQMCTGENYALYEYGRIEDMERIDGKVLYNHYQDILRSSVIDVFAVGEVDLKPLEQKLSGVERSLVSYEYPKTSVLKKSSDIQVAEDKFEVAQGKLAMGFRTNTGFCDEDAFALTLFNSIFGSGAHSKLFNNVREKLSLCYYAYSRLEKQKGIMLVSSGVEFENFKKAHDEILAQLQDIREGKVSDAELNASKKAIVNILMSLNDSAFSMEDFYLSGLIAGKVTDIEEYIRKIEETTLEEVVKVAGKIQLDTVYYLTGKEA